MTSDLVAAAVAAAVGGGVALLGPVVIARLPEPELAEVPEDGERDEGSWNRIAPVYEKTSYADLAARRHLALQLAIAAAALGALLGARLGWNWDLLVVLPLVPAGVWLTYVDWRTTYLPTWIVGPTYPLVILAVLIGSLGLGDWEDARRAVIGWAIFGGWYLLVWLITPGYGYGDVRLAGVLGIALGFLGWPELLIGLTGGVFLVPFGGLALILLRLVDKRRNPAGPHLMVAAVVGAAYGPQIASALGY